MSNLALDPATVASLRTLVPRIAFPDTYQIAVTSTTSDGAGGQIAGAPTVVEAGICRIRPKLSGTEAEAAGRLGYTNAAAVDLPVTTALTPSHQLVIGGRTYEVGAVSVAGAWTIVATALVQEVV